MLLVASKKVVRAPHKVVVDAIRDKIRSENPNCPNKDVLVVPKQISLGTKIIMTMSCFIRFLFLKVGHYFYQKLADFQKVF